MRYYKIDITKPDGTPFIFKSLGIPLTSLLPSGPQSPITGIPNLSALQVELDIGVTNFTSPDSNGAYVRIWGLGLQDIGSAANLNKMGISVYGGMSKGLPLANPLQAGLLVSGVIYQAFGNWINTDQTVDLIIRPGSGTGSVSDPQNFPFIWTAGTPMSQAIATALSTAFPGVQQNINISKNLTSSRDQIGHYPSLGSFSQMVKETSINTLGGQNYGGVNILFDGSVLNVSDANGPTKTAAKAIAFNDLIGQPTWQSPGTISVKTVMRGDIHTSDTVSLPPSLVTQTQQSLLSLSDRSSFSGNYFVTNVHHYGNFRQADAASWNTSFQMAVTPNGG